MLSALPLTTSRLSANRTTHTLRYVLRDRKTDVLLFVVSFNLIPAENADENEPPATEKKGDDKKTEKHEDWEDDLD
jgi:hypothetical protein